MPLTRVGSSPDEVRLMVADILPGKAITKYDYSQDNYTGQYNINDNKMTK